MTGGKNFNSKRLSDVGLQAEWNRGSLLIVRQIGHLVGPVLSGRVIDGEK